MPTLQDFIKWNEDKWEEKNCEMYSQTNNDNIWPWFSKNLDLDVIEYLESNQITCAKILDLGTCSGAQAIALAEKGFDVVGSDISQTALNKAIEAAKKLPNDAKLEFIIDDILESKITEQFDLIIDRGCFHSICCISTKKYIANIQKLLKPQGKLLLKTMSLEEKRFEMYDEFAGQRIPMPYRFDNEIINNIFAEKFNIEKLQDSFFYSTVIDPPAKAKLTLLSIKAP